MHVGYFDWHKPVKVSLVENEKGHRLDGGAKKKALLLSKDSNFRSELFDAFRMLDEGSDELCVDLIESHSNLFLLTPVQRKEIIGKALLSSPGLLSRRRELTEALERIYLESDALVEVRTLIEESKDDEPTDGSGTGVQPAVDTEEDEDEKPEETTDADKDEIVKALEKAAEKAEGDDKLEAKIEGLIKQIESMKDDGDSVPELKEAVALLMM
jgi:hypothetical protein